MPSPKVFLSHASEDKDRFVLSFATALRARGLDAWVDEWEMVPGDSIVRKIFTEGIGEAAAVVVVVSAVSVKKPWVEEELDAAVVKRINEQTRLIPVVLDQLAHERVPVPLRHLLWISVPDPTEIDEAADKVANAVFGVHGKPPLQEPPPYVSAESRRVDDLGQVDSLVLKAAGEEAVRDFGELFQTAEFIAGIESLGISESAAIESLEVLDHDGYVDIRKTLGQGLGSMRSFVLTPYGLDRYLHSYVDGYDAMVNDVCTAVVNRGDTGTDVDITSATGHPRMVVVHILRMLDGQQLLRLSESFGPTSHYFNVSPKLRRMLA